MTDIVVVVPTIREQCIKEFLKAWASYGLKLPSIIVVEDNPTKTFDIEGVGIDHYSWKEIDKELGEDAWIIPRRTAAIRSFGFLKAARMGADVIVTLDDDCLPLEGEDFFNEHLKALEAVKESSAWCAIVGGPLPRGMPYLSDYRSWPPMVNVGLWEGVPDYDAPTQLLRSARRSGSCILREGVASVGQYISMCSMNLAFRVEMLPAMYFLLMGQGYEFSRFEDIWCGILVKRICDHLRLSMSYGKPHVEHCRASDVFTNLQLEAAGLKVNEYFWKAVDDITLTSTTVSGCYRQLASDLPLRLEGSYWEKLSQAMLIWLKFTGR